MGISRHAKCIFLRFSCVKKGCISALQVYYLITKKHFVLANVIFSIHFHTSHQIQRIGILIDLLNLTFPTPALPRHFNFYFKRPQPKAFTILSQLTILLMTKVHILHMTHHLLQHHSLLQSSTHQIKLIFQLFFMKVIELLATLTLI